MMSAPRLHSMTTNHVLSAFYQFLRRLDLPLWLLRASYNRVTRSGTDLWCDIVCTLPSTFDRVSRAGYRCRIGCAHSNTSGCAWPVPIPLLRFLLRDQLVCRGMVVVELEKWLVEE